MSQCHIVVVQRSHVDSKRVEERYLKGLRGGLPAQQFYTESPREALEYIQAMNQGEKLLIVTGSYFIPPELSGTALLTSAAQLHPASIRVMYSLNAVTSPLFAWLGKASLDSHEYLTTIMLSMNAEATLQTLQRKVPYLVISQQTTQEQSNLT